MPEPLPAAFPLTRQALFLLCSGQSTSAWSILAHHKWRDARPWGREAIPVTDWALQRHYARYLVHLPFLYKANIPGSSGLEMGWTFDLSEQGACVELSQRFPPPTSLHLSLQTDRTAIDVDGEVVWAGTPALPGGILHGVIFTSIPPDQLQALRDLLPSTGPAGSTGLRLHLDLPILCRLNGRVGPLLEGRTGDISREGLLIFLPQAIAQDTELEITLHTPTEPLTMPGKIVWVRSPENATPGEPIAHGFRFTSLRWCTPLMLASLLGKPLPGRRRSSRSAKNARAR